MRSTEDTHVTADLLIDSATEAGRILTGHRFVDKYTAHQIAEVIDDLEAYTAKLCRLLTEVKASR